MVGAQKVGALPTSSVAPAEVVSSGQGRTLTGEGASRLTRDGRNTRYKVIVCWENVFATFKLTNSLLYLGQNAPDGEELTWEALC